jgi:hypothetical protein
VAASFGAWYRDWLDAAVRDATPWCQWDTMCCATPSVLSQVVERLEQDGNSAEAARARLAGMKLTLTLKSGGNVYFAPQAPLDPCHGCVALVQSFGLNEVEVFKQVSSQGAEPSAIKVRRRGLLGRLRTLLGRQV